MVVQNTTLTGLDFLIVFFLTIILAWMVALFIHVRTKHL
jgi:hypothetical protein